MKIIIHYPFIAKYRLPVFTLLSKSDKYDFQFWAGKSSNDQYLLTSTENLSVISTPFQTMNIPCVKNEIEWQPRAVKFMLYKQMSAYIVLGNPNSLSTWMCVLLARLRNIPVLMWSHGYLKEEFGLKGFIRKRFYKLANGHLLYGNKAKKIMTKVGFDESKLHVIYNSLDYEKQKTYRDKLSYNCRKETRLKHGFKEDSIVLISIGRLMKKLKLEQIIEAIKIKADEGQDINLIIVGDGPEKKRIFELTKKYDIHEKVFFYGACHEEAELARLYNASDYSVVMGKVGLAAMHALAYGIPLVTNNNIDEHFPEIEAVIDEVTGFYFEDNNIIDFNSKIIPVPYRSKLYKNCIELIETYYMPVIQKRLIEQALDVTLDKHNVK